MHAKACFPPVRLNYLAREQKFRSQKSYRKVTPKLTAASCVHGILGSVGTPHGCYSFWHCCSSTDYILSQPPVREIKLYHYASLQRRHCCSVPSLVKPTNSLHSKAFFVCSGTSTILGTIEQTAATVWTEPPGPNMAAHSF